MYSRQITFLIFVLLLTIIVFQWCQIQNNVMTNRNWRTSDRRIVEHVSKLVIQSSTNNHPIFAMSNIIEARSLLDELLRLHGTPDLIEHNLSLPHGKIEQLRLVILDQEHTITQFVVGQLKEGTVTRTSIDDLASLV
jgi:hypothetical protein